MSETFKDSSAPAVQRYRLRNTRSVSTGGSNVKTRNLLAAHGACSRMAKVISSFLTRQSANFPMTLCLLVAIALVSASDASAQEKKEEARKYSYATKGVVELDRANALWKVLLDESNLGGQELEIAELTLTAGQEVGRHRHGSLEIFYVLSGTFGHEVNGELHMLTPGMVGVVRAGDFVRHLVPKESDVKLLVIWAPGGEARRLLDYAKGKPIEQK
jgi:quercetin dioxygenase-like cupin family protein